MSQETRYNKAQNWYVTYPIKITTIRNTGLIQTIETWYLLLAVEGEWAEFVETMNTEKKNQHHNQMTIEY